MKTSPRRDGDFWSSSWGTSRGRVFKNLSSRPRTTATSTDPHQTFPKRLSQWIQRESKKESTKSTHVSKSYLCWGKKKRFLLTTPYCSPVVTHLSTKKAQCSLTSQSGRDAVLSTRYDRKLEVMGIWEPYKARFDQIKYPVTLKTLKGKKNTFSPVATKLPTKVEKSTPKKQKLGRNGQVWFFLFSKIHKSGGIYFRIHWGVRMKMGWQKFQKLEKSGKEVERR